MADSVDTYSRLVSIRNRRGLHARASAKFCAVAGSFDAVVRVRREDADVGGCSIMGLLMLGAGKGCDIEISATGPQAREVVDTLVRLVEDRFGEGE
ncbi:MAG: HPr family phosphocarrier protein [Alphaproteobacteria bacterium]|nr:HPr family phosphocarrier protein [Alphaproteobacteria bacterium]